MGLVACGIFQDQRWNRVHCIDRQILNHWTTREVLLLSFIGITPQPSCNLLHFEFHLGVCYPEDPNWLRRILDESSVSGLWLVDKEEPLRSFKYGKHDQIWILQMLSSKSEEGTSREGTWWWKDHLKGQCIYWYRFWHEETGSLYNLLCIYSLIQQSQF